MKEFTLVTGVLPKSTVGRKAVPPKAELLEALAAAFTDSTAEVLNAEGDMVPKVYGPASLFDSETRARTDAKRYVTALKADHDRLCTINVYPARENFSAKIVGSDGNTLRFVRVFGANEAEAKKAASEGLKKGESVALVEASTKYLWRLYVPLSGTDGGRIEPIIASGEGSEPDAE
jgi:hypothetical protein